MNKHVIYIPDIGQENLLSQQLALAFKKHNLTTKQQDKTTFVIQHDCSKLKPLDQVNANDTLQIMFTQVKNLNAPLHEQVKACDLINQVPSLVTGLIEDGFNPNNCTIQLYTLEHADQNSLLIKELAKNLIEVTKAHNLIIEWHIIPKLLNLSSSEIDKIFQPNITCHAVYYAVLENNKLNIIQSNKLYLNSINTSSDQIH